MALIAPWGDTAAVHSAGCHPKSGAALGAMLGGSRCLFVLIGWVGD